MTAHLNSIRKWVIHENADMEVQARHKNLQFVQRTPRWFLRIAQIACSYAVPPHFNVAMKTNLGSATTSYDQPDNLTDSAHCSLHGNNLTSCRHCCVAQYVIVPCHHRDACLCSKMLHFGIGAMFEHDRNMGNLEKICAPISQCCLHYVACDELGMRTLGWRHAIRACNLCKAHYTDS